MTLDPAKNFGKVTVSSCTGGCTATATEIVLSTDHGALLPAPATDGAFNLVWWNSTDYPDPSDDPNKEIVRCTARSTDTLTVTRAQEGTGVTPNVEGYAHSTGGKTYKMILAFTKLMRDNINTMLTSGAAITGGSITGITDLAIADGGTGASNAANARTNLGLEAGAAGDIWVEKAGDTMTGNLVVDSATYPVVKIIRETSATDLPLTAGLFKIITSGDMQDGFGAVCGYAIQDTAGVENPIAFIGAIRNGVDNTGDIILRPISAGTQNTRMKIFATGVVDIGATTAPSGGGTPVLVIAQASSAPTGLPSNTAGIYAIDASGTCELYTIDEAGNSTLQTSHPAELMEQSKHEYAHYIRSENPYLGKRITIDLMTLAEEVEKLTGKKIIHIEDIPKIPWDGEKDMPKWMKQRLNIPLDTNMSNPRPKQKEDIPIA